MQTHAQSHRLPHFLAGACAIGVVLWMQGASVGAHAQPAPLPEAASATTPQGIEQTTERLLHEDASTRIEELRIGGQTRRIEVDTKGALPAYLVQPQHANQPGADPQGSAGKSAWRLFSF
jgi:hypothetical protein